MKRLISERTVIEASASGEVLREGPGTIVTAQARDTAKELGVAIVGPSGAAPGTAGSDGPCPEGPAPAPGDPVLDAAEVERIVRLALDRGLWTPADLEAMAEGLGARP